MMDPQTPFCRNPQCPARGLRAQGNIRMHSQVEQQYRCTTCGQTFAASKGTPFYRLRTPADLVTVVLTLVCLAVRSKPWSQPLAWMSGPWQPGSLARASTANRCISTWSNTFVVRIGGDLVALATVGGRLLKSQIRQPTLRAVNTRRLLSYRGSRNAEQVAEARRGEHR
jgi:hypothetical protein